MKRTFKILTLATLLFSNSVLSGGIPTVDTVNVATIIKENSKTLAELEKQLETLKAQIDEAKKFENETQRRFEGNWELGDIISNDAFLNSLPRDARDILTDGMTLAGLRDKYGLKSSNAGVQKNFDQLMAFSARTEKNYNNTLQRLKKLNEIKMLSDSATTPAQKADVSNKLALLQLEFAQEQMALAQSEIQFKTQHDMDINAAHEKFNDAVRQGEISYKNRHKNK